jgi:glycosyltransferase involved in cell wall biosynthesis
MASPPTVSCIIIFLNEERFLADAINSVLAQSYADWELLLVDDGSSDGSSSIALGYATRYGDRIRYLTHQGNANRGMSASRNLGLQHAEGRFVAFLDGDDVWLPDKLAQQIDLFNDHPEAVMVCGATEYWYGWNPSDSAQADRIVHTGEEEGEPILGQDRIYRPPTLLKKLYPLGRGASPSASGYMITRELARAVGGFENAFKGLFEDQVFRAKAYLHGPIFVSSRCFDRYRQHPSSCVHSARASGTNVEARRAYFQWLEGYLDKTSCRDPGVHWQLRWVRFRYEHESARKLEQRLRPLVRTIRRWLSWMPRWASRRP